MNNSQSLSQWLKKRRKELDLTQQELAELVGCSVTTIRKFENNSRRPSKQIAELLADALAIPPLEQQTFIATARRKQNSTTNHRHTNLPAPSTPFVGRDSEIQQILTCLKDSDCRLLTLVGPGGIGKTRLALEVAEMVLPDFNDGVYLVSLASLDSDKYIVSAVAKAIGFTFNEHGDPQNQLRNYLSEKDLLLVMDNFEHLLKGSGLLNEILGDAPHVKMMVTSWERLKLKEEWVVQIQGLAFPDENSSENKVTYPLENFDSVQLFIQLARRVRPNFRLKAELDAVVRICQLVNGMPLAIELGIGWLSTMACHQIATYITQDLDFLHAETRDLPDRHQSLRAIFDRSWELLSSDERDVFMKLSIFRASFTREAAQTIAGATLAIMRTLVEKSLVQMRHDDRYSMHEFLRQYAFEQLDASGELSRVKAKFVQFFVSFAQQAESQLKTSERMDCVRELGNEIDHLRLIREWCSIGDVSLDAEMTILGSLWVYWSWYERDMAETGAWVDEALARAGTIQNIKPLMACYTMGSVSYLQGRYEFGLSIVSEAAAVCRACNDQYALGHILAGVGITLLTLGNPIEAQTVLEESLSIIYEIGEEWFLPIPLLGLANTLITIGDLDRANDFFSKALRIAEKHGHTWEIGLALYFASHCSLVSGDYQQAHRQIEKAIAIHRNTDHVWSLANLLDALGHILKQEGNLEPSKAAFQESLALYEYLGNKRNIANVLISLGKLAFLEQSYQESREMLLDALKRCQEIAYTSGLKSCLTALADDLMLHEHVELAACLLGAAESLSNDIYDPLHAHSYFETSYDYLAARRLIDKAGYRETWQNGTRTPIEQVIKMIWQHLGSR